MDDVENYFSHYLQRDVVFALNNKILKEGKLILFNQKDYYIIFYLKGADGEQKKYEIPYPYSITKNKNYLNLSYDLKDISKNDSELYYKLIGLNQKSNSRLYNNTMLFFEKNALDLSIV
jgi:hypothetical protein